MNVYDHCNEKTRIALELFCKEINDSDADVFVVMAQKAFCLIQLLKKHGQINKDNIYSSAALEFASINFVDKKIVIIDDIVVSGSALSEITNKLYKLGVSYENISFITIARDIDFQTMDFTYDQQSILTCALSLSDPECIELSYDVAKLLSYFGEPYDTDFPDYDEFICDEKIFKKIYVSPFWNTYETTNEEQKLGGITTISLFPTSIFESSFWKKMPVELTNITNLKIRLYIKKHHLGYAVKVLPMVLFDEITHADLDKIFSCFVSNISCFDVETNWSGRTKFKFLQFYLSHQLLKSVLREIDSSIKCILNLEILKSRFGDLIYNSILNILSEDITLRERYTEKFISPSPNTFSYKANFDIEKIPSSTYINNEIFKPFLERHINEEIPTRNQIKDPIKHFVSDYDTIKSYSLRLREGYSFRALLEITTDIKEHYNCEHLISLFLDRAIDLGIIVPIIYHNLENDSYCRAYRHGEDLPFGIADQYRVLYFLKQLYERLYFEYREEVHISTISFEKILVLFFQIGLKNGGLFNRFLGFDNYPLLRQKFCVHGAISTKSSEANPHVYTESISEESNDEWITTWLLNNNYISKLYDKNKVHYSINYKNIEYYLENKKLNNLSETVCSKITIIATMIAKWFYNCRNRKDLFRDDITALTSCTNCFVFASALMTENHYFKKYWEHQVQECFELLKSNQKTSDDFFAPKFSYEKITQALNSGIKKHVWYDDNRAVRVIKEVKKIFEQENDIGLSYFWQDVWQNEIASNFKLPDLETAITEALKYLYFFAACYIWLQDGHLLKSNNLHSEKFNQYYASYKDLILHPEEPDLFSVFEEVENTSDVETKIKILDKKVNTVLNWSEELIEKTESYITTTNKIFTVHYNCCLIVDIETDKTFLTNEILMELWNSLEEDDKKTKLNFVFISVVDGYQRYGMFYSTQDYEEDYYLFDVYLKLRNLLLSYGLDTKSIFIPMLPRNKEFKHDLKNHILNYTKDFNDSFLSNFEKYFEKDRSNQFVFVNVSAFLIGPKNIHQYFEYNVDDFTTNIPDIWEALKIKIFFDKAEPSIDIWEDSTVAIICNDKIIGSGFLFIYDNRIYCISCQHIFKDIEQSPIFAQIKNSNLKFQVEPIKTDLCSQKKNAINEVAIFIPKLQFSTSLHKKVIFSENESAEIDATHTYKCFGFSSSEGDCVNDIKYLAHLNNGYCKMEVPGCTVCGGFSGSAVIYNNKIVGMHYYHEDNTNNQYLKIIPIKIILEKFINEKRGEKNENNSNLFR